MYEFVVCVVVVSFSNSNESSKIHSCGSCELDESKEWFNSLRRMVTIHVHLDFFMLKEN